MNILSCEFENKYITTFHQKKAVSLLTLHFAIVKYILWIYYYCHGVRPIPQMSKFGHTKKLGFDFGTFKKSKTEYLSQHWACRRTCSGDSLKESGWTWNGNYVKSDVDVDDPRKNSWWWCHVDQQEYDHKDHCCRTSHQWMVNLKIGVPLELSIPHHPGAAGGC